MSTLEEYIKKELPKWTPSIERSPEETLGEDWKETIDNASKTIDILSKFSFPSADVIEKAIAENKLNDYNTSALHVHVAKSMQSTKDLFNITEKLRKIRTKEQIVTSFLENIKILQQEFEKVTVKIKKGEDIKVELITKPVSLYCESYKKNVNLGRFRLEFRISASSGQVTGFDRAHSLDKIYPPKQIASGSRRHPHPHIDGTSICMGEAWNYLDGNTQIENLADCAQIMDSLLRTYNEKSPYTHLEKWLEQVCVECGHTGPSDDFTKCSYCDNDVCKSCAKTRTCSSCGKIICKNHSGKRRIEKCEICNELFCGYHINSRRKHKCIRQVEAEAKLIQSELDNLDMSFLDSDFDLSFTEEEPIEEKREEQEQVIEAAHEELVDDDDDDDDDDRGYEEDLEEYEDLTLTGFAEE